jgi:1,2-phenylacetyl-CoA epoxidase PaaB subunit
MGDLLFVVANLARHLKVDPEAALRAANAKFTRRFARIEDWLAEAGKTPCAKRSGRDGRAVEPRQGTKRRRFPRGNRRRNSREFRLPRGICGNLP